MWDYFSQHAKGFWKAFGGGYLLWGSILFVSPPVLSNLWLAFFLKLIGAGALAFVTSLGTLLGKYVVEHRKQLAQKIFKRKQDGKRNKKRAA